MFTMTKLFVVGAIAVAIPAVAYAAAECCALMPNCPFC
jgi:hypothetical protein